MKYDFPYSAIVWLSGGQRPNTWACFRQCFSVDAVPATARFRAAADTKYWLYLNGAPIVREGGLNRESEPGGGYYDEVEIAPFLRKGENQLAVLVWYWGVSGRCNTDSGQAGLLFEIPELGIYSGRQTRALLHPAYGKTGEPLPSYLYGGHNIGFDARRELPDWTLPSFDDSGWAFAEVLPKAVWGGLVKRPIPLHRFSEIHSYPELRRTENQVIGVLPHACQLTAYFRLRAPAGKRVDIRTDRYFVPGGPGDDANIYRGHRVEYLTREGEQTFEALNWMFGEQVVYTLEDGVELLEAGYRETGYNCGFAGDFHCDSEPLSQLVKKAAHTLYVCMRDNFMDCPDRERGQWIGDVSSQIPQTFYCLDRGADQLCRKAIHDFISLRKGAVLVGNVPGENDSELPSQSLNAISEIGMIHEFVRFSGDASPLEEAYPAIRDYLLLWELGGDGFVVQRQGNWRWFDHLENIDGPILENCWYYLALKYAIELAGRFGTAAELLEFQRRADSIRDHFPAFWKGDSYRTGEIPDDRANAMVLLAGLCPDGQVPRVIDVLNTREYATPYMEFYILQAMFLSGYPEAAMERMLRRYKPLIDNENTTLWEDFKVLGTRNHAWSGGPLTLCYRFLAGIFPKDTGMEHILVFPCPTSVNHIRASMETAYGRLTAAIDYDESSFTTAVCLPAEITADIGVPLSHTAGQSQLLLDGIPIQAPQQSGNWQYATVTGGNHTLTCHFSGK